MNKFPFKELHRFQLQQMVHEEGVRVSKTGHNTFMGIVPSL